MKESPYASKWKRHAWEEWDNYRPETRASWERTNQASSAREDMAELMKVFGKRHPHYNRGYVPLERKTK